MLHYINVYYIICLTWSGYLSVRGFGCSFPRTPKVNTGELTTPQQDVVFNTQYPTYIVFHLLFHFTINSQ